MAPAEAKHWLIAIIAVAAGIGVWEGIRLATGQAEAWDHRLYWIIGYPVMLVTALVLGWAAPQRPWRWAALLLLAQAVWSFGLSFKTGGANLFPLGLITFLVLGVPCVLAAYLGAWAARRKMRSI